MSTLKFVTGFVLLLWTMEVAAVNQHRFCFIIEMTPEICILFHLTQRVFPSYVTCLPADIATTAMAYSMRRCCVALPTNHDDNVGILSIALIALGISISLIISDFFSRLFAVFAAAVCVTVGALLLIYVLC